MSNLNPPPNDALTAATQMVKNGRLDQARETLMAYLVKNPSSEQAWLLMSYVLSDPSKQKDCLERVLKINPNNTVAQSKLAHLLGRRTEELFRKFVEPPPAVVPSKPEPEPAPEPAPEPQSIKKAGPIPAATPKPSLWERPVTAATPVQKPEPEPSPEPANLPASPVPPPEKKSLFSGKLFRIVTIILVILILFIAGIILYIGIISPLIQSWMVTPTPTLEPVVFPTFPPEWTKVFTPTKS